MLLVTPYPWRRFKKESADFFRRIVTVLCPPADGFGKIANCAVQDKIVWNGGILGNGRRKQFHQPFLHKFHKYRIAFTGKDTGQIFDVLLQMIEDMGNFGFCIVVMGKVVGFFFAQIMGKNMVEDIRAEGLKQRILGFKMRIEGGSSDVCPVDDTRLQMLFTYAVSSDTRLVKKALLDFHCGMQPNGLLTGKAPCAYCQIISTFSLYYAFALWEYVEHTGDVTLGRLYRPDIDRILDYYDGKRDATGLVGPIGFWPFIDWQDGWKETWGVSPAYFEGPSAIIDLMYAYALECSAKLYEATGRPGTAAEYRQRRGEILRKVKELCFDPEKGMVREGPACQQFTRHAQAWAVINGMLDETESRRALQASSICPPCSFSTSYEWFRALERAGLEEQMRRDLDAWIGLLSRGSTTCPEEPHHPRSECHAWSALPLYEFMRTWAGIRQESGKIVIQPRLFDLPDLSGTAITPLGSVRFHYQSDHGVRQYDITLPDQAEGRLILPSGKQLSFSDHLRYTE